MFLGLRDIRKSYGNRENRVEVLKGISFDAEKGELVVLLGPSGCGKSTLLNIIGGIDEADSGALTIACAKKNPRAQMLGIDTWGPEYQAFSRIVCEKNAAAEGVTNARFEKGNACHLDYPDESFDCVVSNYVYHNIVGKDRRKILRESLRVLKKGGTFAIHDLMSKGRFGDMHAFADSLQAEGYQEVHLTDTTKQFFRSPAEARLLMLGSSTLLWGTK